jgi:hypothetical protein
VALEAHRGAMKAHHGALEAYFSAMKAHRGAVVLPRHRAGLALFFTLRALCALFWDLNFALLQNRADKPGRRNRTGRVG